MVPIRPDPDMIRLAIRSLFARKARTGLALTGLAVAILGVIALISVSRGIQALLRETLTRVPGVTVLQREVPSLGFSSLPLDLGKRIEEVPGAGAAFAQVWYPAFEVEGENLIMKGDPFNMFMLLGVDMTAAGRMRDRGPILGSLREGRDIARDPPGALEVVIPRAAARRFGKKIGDTLTVQGRKLAVVGVFHSGSLFFDRCLVVPLDVAREVAGKSPNLVSSFYVEVAEGVTDAAPVARRIEEKLPDVRAWTTEDVNREAASLWAEVDAFLLAIASIAVVVGAVGIVNTMLMSVIERTGELGVLRATGWTQRDVMRLILIESAGLGVGGGALGCAIGAVAVATAGAFLPLKPVVTAPLLFGCLGLAVVLGTLGGLYPAWRAARLDPIEAIRS